MNSRQDVPTPGESSEAGLSLIEVLIYMVLAVVVLIIVGGLLIASLTSERKVRDSTQASNTGQLVARSVGEGVRNARAIKITSPSGGGQLLMVRTASVTTSQTWLCQAWYFGGGILGEVRTRTTSPASAIPSLPADIATWTLLGTGINPVSGGAVVTALPITDPPIMNPRSIQLTFDVTAGTGKPVRINTAATSLQPVPVPVPASGVESSPCF